MSQINISLRDKSQSITDWLLRAASDLGKESFIQHPALMTSFSQVTSLKISKPITVSTHQRSTPTACPTAAVSSTPSHALQTTVLLLPHSPRYPAPFTPIPITATAHPPDRPFPFSNSMAMPTRPSIIPAESETAVPCLRSQFGFHGGLGGTVVPIQQRIRKSRTKMGTSISPTHVTAARILCVIIKSGTSVTNGPTRPSLFHRSMHHPLSWIFSIHITDLHQLQRCQVALGRW